MPTPDVEVGGLIAKGITKSYRRGMWPRRRELAVLRGADFEVGVGEVVGLVGENGSGKSTLMKILVGALAADSGTINVTGRMGYCPQEPVLYDRLTCEEHLELFGVAYGMDDTAVAAAADGLYATLGFERWRTTRAEELSGGTRSKLNLAVALLADPEVLLLDEPYAGGLIALFARVGISDLARAISATLVIAVIYLAFGVLVGTFVKSEMNGALLVTLVWVFDVFLGPALTSGSSTITRVFPLHFPTLVLTAQASRHAGPLGDVGWSILWAVGLSFLAVVRLVATTRPAPPPSTPPSTTIGARATPVPAMSTSNARVNSPTSAPRKPAQTAAPPMSAQVRSRTPVKVLVAPVSVRVAAVFRAGMREYRRNRVLWVLLVAVQLCSLARPSS